MNNKTQEALKMAIEVMQRYLKETPLGNQPHMIAHKAEEVIQACKEALAQPAQEPVAWMNPSNGAVISDRYKKQIGLDGKVNGYKNFSVPLTDHFAPSWQGLSDDEIRVIAAINFCIKLNEVNDADIDFAKDIEQALRQRNCNDTK